jgi:hypothetical protein
MMDQRRVAYQMGFAVGKWIFSIATAALGAYIALSLFF